MSDPVKVHARLNDPEGYGGESFWASPTGTPNVYEVGNVLIAAPIGLGDLVRVKPHPDTVAYVESVVQRTGRITLGCRLIDPDDPGRDDPASQLRMSEAHESLANAGRAHGAHSEGWQVGLLGFVLPEDVSDPGSWLDQVLADSNGHGLELEWDVLTGPHLPTGVSSTYLFNPENDDVEPLSDDVWGPEDDPGCQQAITALRTSGNIPAWVTDDELTSTLAASYRRDQRVRIAVARGGYTDVLVLAVRVLASRAGIPLPTLERPLFTAPGPSRRSSR